MQRRWGRHHRWRCLDIHLLHCSVSRRYRLPCCWRLIPSLILLFFLPDTIFLSVAVDVGVITCLFILMLGATAAESSVASFFRFYSDLKFGQLGQATIAMAWLLTLLVSLFRTDTMALPRRTVLMDSSLAS